jgi:hypothetical protein
MSQNITGYKIQTMNLSAGQPQEVTGPARGFEVLVPGEAGTKTVIQAERQTQGQFSDDSGIQAFDSTPGLRLVNFDKLVVTSYVDSQMKIKIFTGKTIATVDTGPQLVAARTLWSTNVPALALTTGTDPYELTGDNVFASGAYTSRSDGARELKFTDRAAINNSVDWEVESNSFGQIHNSVFGWWTGWLSGDTSFDLDVYAATYNPGTGSAVFWTLVQKFASAAITTGGDVPANDGSQTFNSGQNVITFDGQDTKDYLIPYGSLRVYLTGYKGGTLNVRGILGARAAK